MMKLLLENWRKYLKETDVGKINKLPIFDPCFKGREQALIPLLGKTLEIIEVVINKNIDNWPQRIECMTKEEIEEGEKEGGGHGLYIDEGHRIKINPTMDTFNIYLNFIHENFHHAKPELTGPKYSPLSRHIEINESLMKQVIDNVLAYINENPEVKVSDEFIINLEEYNNETPT